MDVKYAVGLPTVGEFGDVATLVDTGNLPNTVPAAFQLCPAVR